jgi:hypothetical protein
MHAATLAALRSDMSLSFDGRVRLPVDQPFAVDTLSRFGEVAPREYPSVSRRPTGSSFRQRRSAARGAERTSIWLTPERSTA